MPGQIGVAAERVKCPQRLAMNDQRDSDVIRSADAVEMVLDVAEHKADLVEVGEVIDDFQLASRRGVGGGTGAGCGESCTES